MEMTANPIQAWESRDDRQRLLQIDHPALNGLNDGTLSTTKPSDSWISLVAL